MLSGLHRSRGVVLKLSALFALDSFGGGFIVQSFVAYWFALRFDIGANAIGAVFFSANLLAGVSALVAARIARRFGLVRTMVVTHLPSNVLLFLVPLIWITSRRSLMGSLVNTRFTTVVAIAIATVIITLNVVLLVDLAL